MNAEQQMRLESYKLAVAAAELTEGVESNVALETNAINIHKWISTGQRAYTP